MLAASCKTCLYGFRKVEQERVDFSSGSMGELAELGFVPAALFPGQPGPAADEGRQTAQERDEARHPLERRGPVHCHQPHRLGPLPDGRDCQPRGAAAARGQKASRARRRATQAHAASSSRRLVPHDALDGPGGRLRMHVAGEHADDCDSRTGEHRAA